MYQVGKIKHFYNKLGVAVLELDKDIHLGAKLRIGKPGSQFDESVSSMQIDHHVVVEAHKGDDVALKVDHKVHEGDLVFRLEEKDTPILGES